MSQIGDICNTLWAFLQTPYQQPGCFPAALARLGDEDGGDFPILQKRIFLARFGK